MPKKKNENPKGLCRLDLSPGSGEKCSPGECKSCGWNDAVDRQRKLQIRQKGLEKGEDGKRCLLIRKEKGNGEEPVCGRDEPRHHGTVRHIAGDEGHDGPAETEAHGNL